MSGSDKLSAPTRIRTSRLRHRGPVLCPAELWTHDHEDGSPDRDRTCCLLGRSQVLRPDELRSHETESGWTGRDRTGRLPPYREGALPLSYRPLAAAPGFESGRPRVNSSMRYRLAPRGSGGEKGIR